MPNNNPTRDHFDPPSNLSMDFEEYNFEDLEVEELFWQTNIQTENNPWRKVGQNQGLNLKTNTTHNFQLNTVVYQKI